MPAEIELKLALPAAAVPRLVRHPLLRQAEALPSHTLFNHYFDTPDLALAAQRVAVRTRRQGRQWLQTVKCGGSVAAGLSHRPEWEQPYRRGRFDFSAIDAPALRTLLESPAIAEALAPVFSTNFHRRTWRVCPGAEVEILVMLDRGEVIAGTRRQAICELELELVRGEASALFNLAQHLATRLPLRLDNVSKAARGYRLLRGEPPRPTHASRVALVPSLTPVEAFLRVGHAGLAHVQANEEGLMGAADPEFVHQARVALRRLRASVRFFAPALPPGTAAHWLRRLGELARALEEARELDVLAGLLNVPEPSVEPADQQALASQVDALRHAAQQDVARGVAEGVWGPALLDFSAFLHRLPTGAPAQGDLAAFVRERLRQAWNRVERHSAGARGRNAAASHRLRIAVKQLRYSLESCAALLPARPLATSLEQLSAMQEALGRRQDLTSVGPRLMNVAGADPGLRLAATRLLGTYALRTQGDGLALGEAPQALARTRNTLNIKVAIPRALAI